MSEEVKFPDSFRLALEAALAQTDYEKRYPAPVHLVRRYADMLDRQPDKLPTLGPKYFSALATLNLVPVRDVRKPQEAPEAKKDEQPESGPTAALHKLRAVHGPHARAS